MRPWDKPGFLFGVMGVLLVGGAIVIASASGSVLLGVAGGGVLAALGVLVASLLIGRQGSES